MTAFVDRQIQGGFLNRPKNVRPPSLSGPVPDLLIGLGAQRHRIATLSKTAKTLQSRGKHLLAESNSLAEKFGQASRSLAETYAKSKTALGEIRLPRSAREHGPSTPRGDMPERVIEDSPEMVEALQQATEILKLEFSDLEGSGRETLAKCERVLQRTRRVLTIELRLA
jgi:hypothetical protein